MNKLRYFFAFFAILIVATSATSSVHLTPKTKIIKIKNTTNFDIDEIYLSPTDETHWGEDILDPDEILTPNEVIEVEIDCGTWDVKLVAEDKSTCEIENVSICAAAQWNIVANCK